jgi:hypothetical protein
MRAARAMSASEMSKNERSSINAAALSRMRSRICVPSGAAMAIAPIFFV